MCALMGCDQMSDAESIFLFLKKAPNIGTKNRQEGGESFWLDYQ
jgi:hypothetical protein